MKAIIEFIKQISYENIYLEFIEELALLAITSFICFLIIRIIKHFLFKKIRQIYRAKKKNQTYWIELAIKNKLFKRLFYLIPILFTYEIYDLFLKDFIVFYKLNLVFIKILKILIVIISSMIFNSFIKILELKLSEKLEKNTSEISIKTVIQATSTFIWIATVILIITIFADISVGKIFTTFGAVAALLTFVFQDIIKGLIACIQVVIYDILRIGDWVEITGTKANGTVKYISLNIIKIENFDRTLITLPTQSIMSSGIINYSTMTRSNTRRLYRSIPIDATNLKKLTKEEFNKIISEEWISRYITEKEFNNEITNVTLFRMYAQKYLKFHPKIDHKSTIIVNTLESVGYGIPVSFYFFTNTSNWANFENIQSEILEYLLSRLYKFDLKVYSYV